jgi:hypothetical protein
MNREWHKQNKMPRNPTVGQRLAWHLQHAKKCGCRDMPPSVRAAIAERGLNRPGDRQTVSGKRRVRFLQA